MPSIPSYPVSRAVRYLLVLAATAAIGACGGSSDTGTGPGSGPGTPVTPGTPVATTAVTMRSLAFTPPSIVVATGSTVTFTNQDGVDHNVTFDAGTVGNSGTVSAGAVSSVVMPSTPGTYTYHCTFHSGMNGSVTVQ